ncbi:hypothetical protein J1N35_034806 [Gossypium stocksii]|uniref:Uncharacterized protein n=1 Tax=Gossypium stocksii TaxID=47602 RepID=A0A9D3UT16_9ROSI|nr:hypothetical protein J1N35_034806 [Gossypium stocksii]
MSTSSEPLIGQAWRNSNHNRIYPKGLYHRTLHHRHCKRISYNFSVCELKGCGHLCPLGGCDFFKWVEKQDGNGNLDELKEQIEMLLIENREIKIENTELKKMIKVDEIEKLVRNVAKKKEKLRGYKLLVTTTKNDVYFYKVAFIAS